MAQGQLNEIIKKDWRSLQSYLSMERSELRSYQDLEIRGLRAQFNSQLNNMQSRHRRERLEQENQQRLVEQNWRETKSRKRKRADVDDSMPTAVKSQKAQSVLDNKIELVAKRVRFGKSTPGKQPVLPDSQFRFLQQIDDTEIYLSEEGSFIFYSHS